MNAFPLATPLRAAYLGPEGTFSYFAAHDYLHGHMPARAGEAACIACPDLADVFEAVASGACLLGFVPLENSLRGTVGQSFDLFLQHDVTIVAELYARISHCLLGHENNLAAIRVVYSHPQPLAQAGGWLRAHLPGVPQVALESTAAAAQRAAAEPGAAAVGHWRLSALHKLHVLARAIEDDAANWTRFVIITRDRAACSALVAPGTPPGSPPSSRDEHRSSLLFTLPDKPGALAAILNLLAEADINMRKLESRPLIRPGGENWKYAFFVDVECDMGDAAHAPVLEALRGRCETLRLLGTYPQGPYLRGLNND